jgi:hypothetical protein
VDGYKKKGSGSLTGKKNFGQQEKEKSREVDGKDLGRIVKGCSVSCRRAWLNARIFHCAWQLAELL